MELTDKNETGNYSTYNFNKSTEEFTITPSDEDSFNSIAINWIPKQTTTNVKNIFLVYPSPTNGLLQIKGDNIELIVITDINCQIVYQGESTNINLQKQKCGVYFVRIKTAENIIVKKVLKQLYY